MKYHWHNFTTCDFWFSSSLFSNVRKWGARVKWMLYNLNTPQIGRLVWLVSYPLGQKLIVYFYYYGITIRSLHAWIFFLLVICTAHVQLYTYIFVCILYPRLCPCSCVCVCLCGKSFSLAIYPIYLNIIMLKQNNIVTILYSNIIKVFLWLWLMRSISRLHRWTCEIIATKHAHLCEKCIVFATKQQKQQE